MIFFLGIQIKAESTTQTITKHKEKRQDETRRPHMTVLAICLFSNFLGCFLFLPSLFLSLSCIPAFFFAFPSSFKMFFEASLRDKQAKRHQKRLIRLQQVRQLEKENEINAWRIRKQALEERRSKEQRAVYCEQAEFLKQRIEQLQEQLASYRSNFGLAFHSADAFLSQQVYLHRLLLIFIN